MREKAGISLRQVAESMHISAPYLSDLELGRRYWHGRVADYKDALKGHKSLGRGSVVVYGLFDDEEKCRYVGYTAEPSARRIQHKCTWKKLVFRILVKCLYTHTAKRVEYRTILKYKKTGQCDLNKITTNPDT